MLIQKKVLHLAALVGLPILYLWYKIVNLFTSCETPGYTVGIFMFNALQARSTSLDIPTSSFTLFQPPPFYHNIPSSSEHWKSCCRATSSGKNIESEPCEMRRKRCFDVSHKIRFF